MNRRRKDVLDDAVLMSSSERFFTVCIILNVSGYLDLVLLSKALNTVFSKTEAKGKSFEVLLVLCVC